MLLAHNQPTNHLVWDVTFIKLASTNPNPKISGSYELYRRTFFNFPSTLPRWGSSGFSIGPIAVHTLCEQLSGHLELQKEIFADNTKLYRSVSCHTYPHRIQAMPHALQEDLDAAVCRAYEWQLSFNASKCHVLHIGYLNCHHVYILAGSELDKTGADRDRGVDIDADLKFRRQAAAAVSKASRWWW